MMDQACPLCGASEPLEIFALNDMPLVCNQLWPDAEAAAKAPLGDIDLVICEGCALIWNHAFQANRMVYAPGYENALHFSPRFQAFADELAAGLVARYDLAERDIIEIGCGDGHMLDLMAKHGVRTAIGFDPSMQGVTTSYTQRNGVEIVPEYLSSKDLDRPFDAILCRHVLEHLEDPVPLLRDIRHAIGNRDVAVYFEVPNAGWMLDNVSMWDVIYEHVTYWTAPAITALFRRTGFEPVSVSAGYGGQFLMIEAKPSEPDLAWKSGDTASIRAAATGFKAAVGQELAKWHERFARLDGRAVIWGAGSKGITFANALGQSAGALAALVDLNPRKHGLAVPGVALPVIAPEELAGVRPDLLLISNALYEPEISARMRSMGLHSAIGVIAG